MSIVRPVTYQTQRTTPVAYVLSDTVHCRPLAPRCWIFERKVQRQTARTVPARRNRKGKGTSDADSDGIVEFDHTTLLGILLCF